MADLDAPLRCMICGELLDEDPRDRGTVLIRPPNAHQKCFEEFGAEMRANDPYPDLDEDPPEN